MLTIWACVISISFWSLVQQASASLPVPVCSLEAQCEEYHEPDSTKRFFKVNGTKVIIDGNARQLSLECVSQSGPPPPLAVDALPSFSEEQHLDELFLVSCALGRAGVRDVLRALHVRVRDKLELRWPQERLTSDHVRGLAVRRLGLEVDDPFRTRLDDDFFADLNLTYLWTSGVEYDVPPAGLETWTTKNANYSALPRGALAALRALHVSEPRLRDVSALEEAVRLRDLSVQGGARGPLPALPALRSLWTQGWAGLERAPLACPQLDSLTLVAAAPLRPVPRWLAGCARLARLELRWSPLLALPGDMLRGARELRELVVRRAGLTSTMLPDDLLETNTELVRLDLSHNKLTTVPSEVFFKHTLKLSELDLSWNMLRSPPAWSPSLPVLGKLTLDHNPLGDACVDAGTEDIASIQWSWLHQLRSLHHLSLRNTSQSRVCPDWLLAPRLATLDLQDNLITQLKYEDLHPVRSQPSSIVLQGNAVTSIRYSPEDFHRIRTTDRSETKITLDASASLRCDCFMYWFARALHVYTDHVRISSLPCRDVTRDVTDLTRVPLDQLTCDVECPDECYCSAVPARAALEARCEALPVNSTLHSNFTLVTNLSLAGLGLKSVPLSILPTGLRTLDLRNNSLQDADQLRGLLKRPGLRMCLAGNPIDCNCGAREFLDMLLENKHRIEDAEEVRCADGRRAAEGCEGGGGGGGGRAGGLAALGVLLLVAVMAAAALLHPAPRAKVKVILMVLGVRVPRSKGQAWQYDAFVSFAEADATFVASILVPSLESGRRPRRLCLHHRDWSAGELIVSQIERSVSASQRTVLVVSDAFARSQWTQLELELALSRAAARGLAAPLAILLQTPSEAALAAAPSLAQYLRAATYLRADDPAFRRKLRAAVPASPAPLPEAPAA